MTCQPKIHQIQLFVSIFAESSENIRALYISVDVVFLVDVFQDIELKLKRD
jgi:hypothetical protein